MCKEDCDACLDLFSRVNLSRQQQRELVEWLPEIAFAEAKTICALLNESQIKEILENESVNQPQKAQKIRDLIFKKRFPDLAALKQKWSVMVNKVNPDQARIHFNVPEAFEKNRLEVKIILDEAQKAVELIAKLGSICKETWEKLIYPGNQ
jgi:adenylate cyclase class IV